MPSSIPAAASSKLTMKSPLSMDRTAQWVLSQDVAADLIVRVGDATFHLHKMALLPKSRYIWRKVTDLHDPTLPATIDLSGLPGGADAFEKVAKFCYGVDFDISVHDAAALRCTAEYLEMAEEGGDATVSLARRADEFMTQSSLRTLPGAVTVLRSCDGFLPLAEQLGIVQRCVDAISVKVLNEARFPTRSPHDWWAAELASLDPVIFRRILAALRVREATVETLVVAVLSYAELSLPGLISGFACPVAGESFASRRPAVESVISLLPPDREVPLPVAFLCLLLRAANATLASEALRRDVERRVASALEQATPADLLTLAVDPCRERVGDLDCVRRVLVAFVEAETGPCSVGSGSFHLGGGPVLCSAALQKVARTVDAFAAEIAPDADLTVSKLIAVTGALPKAARRVDDDLYRAIDIYLKAHPALDEIEREKVCSVMDPLKLSYEARLHAGQNKRLPLQTALTALYYDQLQLRSGGGAVPAAAAARGRANADLALARENDALRSELERMRAYVSALEGRGGVGGSGPKPAGVKRTMAFFSNVSKKLGRLNPFKTGSKDTSSIASSVQMIGEQEQAKPRRRRFSIS